MLKMRGGFGIAANLSEAPRVVFKFLGSCVHLARTRNLGVFLGSSWRGLGSVFGMLLGRTQHLKPEVVLACTAWAPAENSN